MQCPICRNLESRVVDSRLAAGARVVWRRRECDSCHHRFTTYERVEYALPTVVKRDGKRQAFDRDKLLRGLQVACNKRPISTESLEEIVESLARDLSQKGEKEVSSGQIGEKLMEVLKNLDDVAYVRFASVYKSFRDIDEFMNEMSSLVRKRDSGE